MPLDSCAPRSVCSTVYSFGCVPLCNLNIVIIFVELPHDCNHICSVTLRLSSYLQCYLMTVIIHVSAFLCQRRTDLGIEIVVEPEDPQNWPWHWSGCRTRMWWVLRLRRRGSIEPARRRLARRERSTRRSIRARRGNKRPVNNNHLEADSLVSFINFR